MHLRCAEAPINLHTQHGGPAEAAMHLKREEAHNSLHTPHGRGGRRPQSCTPSCVAVSGIEREEDETKATGGISGEDQAHRLPARDSYYPLHLLGHGPGFNRFRLPSADRTLNSHDPNAAFSAA